MAKAYVPTRCILATILILLHCTGKLPTTGASPFGTRVQRDNLAISAHHTDKEAAEEFGTVSPLKGIDVPVEGKIHYLAFSQDGILLNKTIQEKSAKTQDNRTDTMENNEADDARSPHPARAKREITTAQCDNLATATRSFSSINTELSTIEPGSRPLSSFDNDPTVLCADNPYQTKCANENSTQLALEREYITPYYFSNNITEKAMLKSQRMPCAHFYNTSDNQLLWWQELQRDATFYPEIGVLSIAGNNECPEDDQIHFYINDTNAAGIKYVEWDRGLHLRQKNNLNTTMVQVCLFTPESDINKEYAINLLYSFLYCLINYGTGLANDTVQ